MNSVPDPYDELLVAIKGYAAQSGKPDDHYLIGQFYGAPGEAASNLLCADALGSYELSDEQVGHFWTLCFEEGYTPEEAVPDSVLTQAREGRRSRPPQPVRFPLKGGGHGTGRGIPGKAEWPARWSDDDAIAHVMDVAREPDGAVAQPDGTFRAWGVRDGVDIRVVVTSAGEVLTAYPVSGDGVVHNPLDDVRASFVARLADLIAAAALDQPTGAGLDELMQAGEWDQVLLALRAVDLPQDTQQELAELSRAADL